MGPTIESTFQEMMQASFGDGWLDRLDRTQIKEMRRAFFGGVVSTLSHIAVDPRVNAPRDPLEPWRRECAEYLRSVRAEIEAAR